MIVKFSEIVNEIRGLHNLSDTIEDNVLASIKLRINQVQDFIFYYKRWEWRKRRYYFTTRAPYETGTITVTQNSVTITGSGSTWVDSMKDGFILIKSRPYKIIRIASTTSIKLAAPYPGDTESDLAYKIIFPHYRVNPNFSSIANILHEGREMKACTIDRMIVSDAATGAPEEIGVGERTDYDYESSGTVDVTNLSASVSGNGSAFEDNMIGMEFRVNEFAESYIIKEVLSAASITLDRPYKGTTGTGKAYKVGPAGGFLFQIRSVPDDYYYMEVEGLLKPEKLVHDNDISLIPNHAPLLHGAIWLALLDMKDANPVRIQQARADFEKTLRQLEDSYKVVDKVRWESELEIASRARGGVSRFNPLER
jgi:hypothetical protein